MKTIFLTVLLFLNCYIVIGQSLLTDTIRLEEVVVTSSKVEVSRMNVPLTVSVITREELEESTESALLPILSEQVPGLFVTERGVTGFGVADGAAGQINIRGLGGNPTTQVLILIDGHPQFMGMMGHHLPDAYVTSDVEKVEVIRGPASILYGSNAFGGVINIITKKQKNDGIQANGRIMYGSYNTQKYMTGVGFKDKGFSLYTSFNHDRTDGHRDSSDFRITNGYIKGGYKFNEYLKVFADFSIAHYKTSDPGPVDGFAGYRINIWRGETALSLENSLPKCQGALKFYYNFGDHNISDGWHSNDVMYGLMFYQGFSLFNGNTITAGYDYMQYGGKGSPITTVLRDEEGNVIMPPQFVMSETNDRWIDMSNNAVYAFIQQKFFKNLILNTGIRYDMNETYGNEWIPQVGLAWHLAISTTIKGSISKGYRPPSIRELYLFPPANEKLLPERMLNYELGWMQYLFGSKMKTELTGFISSGDNMIIMVPAAPPPPPQYKNTGIFNNRGIEFSCDYSPKQNLKFNTNYTFINMKTPLPATPEHNLYLSGTYKIAKFSFNAKLQNIFNLYGEKDGKIVVVEDSYHLFGIRIGYSLNRYVNFFVNGENMLNQKYQINNGYPMPGITVFGGVNLKYTKD